MTPNNIVHMGILNGLDVLALTDHNTCKNCPAFVQAAKRSGILGIPGMELCTAEEIHVVFLFAALENAMAFDRYVYDFLPPIENRVQIFGNQWILDEEDRQIGTEKRMLINATTLPVSAVKELADTFGGVVFPAHVDKNAYSVLSNLGFIPPECAFTTVEVKNPDVFLPLEENRAKIAGMRIITDSDAHYLWDIAAQTHSVKLEACSANQLIRHLRASVKD